ncbi:uncharacterized protein LOC124820579 [Vigna umbellata]|uniref:uncharacterized protein LOC124820579 n=1 Tax=Vigna umbellata TaxID=87088 RepID=UPI001F5F1403|nr:uncharacterized protein LOC124820579 [Vigna umbellata]
MPRVSANPSSSRFFSMASTVRAYTLPIILFAGAMYYQLFVIPNAFPRSHYDVLQIESYSSVDKVKEAYENLESKMNSAEEAFDTHKFLKVIEGSFISYLVYQSNCCMVHKILLRTKFS